VAIVATPRAGAFARAGEVMPIRKGRKSNRSYKRSPRDHAPNWGGIKARTTACERRRGERVWRLDARPPSDSGNEKARRDFVPRAVQLLRQCHYASDLPDESNNKYRKTE
jgi:hypothetical protein